jgi:hypothetical protein
LKSGSSRPRGPLPYAAPAGASDRLLKSGQTECRMQNAECEMQNAKCKMQNAKGFRADLLPACDFCILNYTDGFFTAC